MILLPLRTASLMYKNTQRHKITHGMRPRGCKDRLIDLNMSFSKTYPVYLISVAVIMAVV